MLVAGCYARKSTDEPDKDDKEKSVPFSRVLQCPPAFSGRVSALPHRVGQTKGPGKASLSGGQLGV
jgi:hypothetical protein